VEPKVSAWRLQEPTTSPHAESDVLRLCHLTLSWRSILILSFHLYPGILSDVCPPGFATNIQHTFLFYPYMPHAQPVSSSLTWLSHNIWWGQILKLITLEIYPVCCYFLCLWPKLLPQHLLITHPQPLFIFKCATPGFTPMWRNIQSYYCATGICYMPFPHHHCLHLVKWKLFMFVPS